MSVWKSDEKLLSFASLISPSKIINFVWEVISSIRHSVSSPNETPQTARRISVFLLGWNTASHAWYITSRRSRPQLIFVFTFQKKIMVKTPSFTSVTRNSHPPNVYSVPEFSSPLSNACQSSVHQQGKKWFAIQPKRINS